MIPTFFGVTFLVFFILQVAPDGPFERAVKQLKQAQGAESESGSDGSSSILDSTGELTPELLDKLRAQYGLDKPIIIRYLIWVGIWPKEYKVKSVKLDKSSRETIEKVKVDKYKEYLLQRYIKVVKDDHTNDYIIIETGAGLELPIPYLPTLEEIHKFNNTTYELKVAGTRYDYLTKELDKLKEMKKTDNVKFFYLEGKMAEKELELEIATLTVKIAVLKEIIEQMPPSPAYSFSQEVINNLKFYKQNYEELPSNDKIIKTWYESDWIIKKSDTENGIFTLIKKQNKGILTGYLGYSSKKGKDVTTLYMERLHISAIFGVTSFLLVYFICIPLGILKAIKHGSKFDVISSFIVFTGYSIPGYILGLVLLVYFGGDIFPLHGWRSENFNDLSLINKIKDQIWHAFLPLLAYMVGSFATMTVLMKNSLMENLSQDYVRTAFAKGLSEKRVILAHAVRNSLIPLATGIGGFVSIFFAGSFLIEKTFGIDGIGLLGFNALIERDYDIMMGTLAFGTIIGQLGNLISDIAYAIVDPRIRFK